MIRARRLGPITLATPDVASQVNYYSNIIGLAPVTASEDRAVLVTAVGDEAIILERDDAMRLRAISLQIAPTEQLSDVVTALGAMGVQATRISGFTPGIAEVVQFVDPTGTTVQLFADAKPHTAYIPTAGLGPLKLGHVARKVAELPAVADYYQRVLGFRVSDWKMAREHGNDYAVFMRSGVDHHTMNFFNIGTPGLHHIAFEMKDWSELGRAADFLTARGLKLDWGPGRHVIGHNLACYHSNSDGVRVELYAEMDQMIDEELGYFAPRPWHQDRPQYPKRWAASIPRNFWLPDLP